jgi:hypothetical protein
MNVYFCEFFSHALAAPLQPLLAAPQLVDELRRESGPVSTAVVATRMVVVVELDGVGHQRRAGHKYQKAEVKQTQES